MSNDIKRDSLQDRFANLAWWLCVAFAAIIAGAGGWGAFPLVLITVFVAYGLHYLISGRSD